MKNRKASSIDYVDRLRRFVPPPDDPPRTNVNWHFAESILGLNYPTDFKDFVAAYGSLNWYDIFWPLYCCGESREECLLFQDDMLFWIACVGRPEEITLDWRYLHRRAKKLLKYPDPGGIFPFMQDYMAHTYFWITEGDPETWRIVRLNGRDNVIAFFPEGVTLTEVLCKWIENIPPFDGFYSRDELEKPAFARR